MGSEMCIRDRDKAAEWRNPDTGNYGRIVPVTTYRQNGRYCREFTQEIFIGGQKQLAMDELVDNLTVLGK